MNTETPVGTKQITVSNITIDIVRKDIKNIHLGVYPPAGRVRIAAPMQVKDDTIRLFAISKLSWIRRQQRQFAEQERLRSMLARGLRGFMPKPYTQQKLLTQVRATLDALNAERTGERRIL